MSVSSSVALEMSDAKPEISRRDKEALPSSSSRSSKLSSLTEPQIANGIDAVADDKPARNRKGGKNT